MTLPEAGDEKGTWVLSFIPNRMPSFTWNVFYTSLAHEGQIAQSMVLVSEPEGKKKTNEAHRTRLEKEKESGVYRYFGLGAGPGVAQADLQL